MVHFYLLNLLFTLKFMLIIPFTLALTMVMSDILKHLYLRNVKLTEWHVGMNCDVFTSSHAYVHCRISQ